MAKTVQRVIIDAPVEVVRGYLFDPAHLQEYFGSDVEVKDIQRLPNGGYRYAATEKILLGLRSTTTSEDVEVVPNVRTVSKTHSTLGNGSVLWQFEQQTDGKTRVSIVEEFIVRGGPLGKLVEALFARSFKEGVRRHLEAAKARIEARTPSATPS